MDSTRNEIAALRAEIDRLNASERMRSRIHQCARAMDRLDRGLLEAQFWPDAEVDYGKFYRGPVCGFLDVAMDFSRSMRDTQHIVGNTLLDIQGDRAAAESYVRAHHVIVDDDDLVQLMVGGRYLDRFVRRGDDWRLSYRTEILDWGRWLPVPERWFESNDELPKGLRGNADLSYRFLGRVP